MTTKQKRPTSITVDPEEARAAADKIYREAFGLTGCQQLHSNTIIERAYGHDIMIRPKIYGPTLRGFTFRTAGVPGSPTLYLSDGVFDVTKADKIIENLKSDLFCNFGDSWAQHEAADAIHKETREATVRLRDVHLGAGRVGTLYLGTGEPGLVARVDYKDVLAKEGPFPRPIFTEVVANVSVNVVAEDAAAAERLARRIVSAINKIAKPRSNTA